MKRRWRVDAGERTLLVEADEIEIGGSGVLVFYRVASRRETERTILLAFASGAWSRAELANPADE